MKKDKRLKSKSWRKSHGLDNIDPAPRVKLKQKRKQPMVPDVELISEEIDEALFGRV
jgi:hypothetical protein